MLVESTEYQRVKPKGKLGRWHVPWPEALARARRTIADCGMEAEEETVATTTDGQEAVVCLKVGGHSLAPRNATVHFGFVAPRPTYRGAYCYGGVELGGAPAVLDCYGSYKAGEKFGHDNWGITLDRCIAKFSVDVQNYDNKISRLKNVKVPRLNADAVCYRIYADRILTPSRLWELNRLRPALRDETAWELLSSLNAMVSMRVAICTNPRSTQLGGYYAVLQEIKRQCPRL